MTAEPGARVRRDRTSGTTERLSRHNAEQILRSVLASGPQPRVKIAKLTGLSMPSVTRLSARLVGSGILVEALGHRARKRGRPEIPLDIDTVHRAILAVHLGMDELRVGIVDLRGLVIGERRVPLGSRNDPRSIVDLAAAEASSLLERAAPDRIILGCGASIGGWVDPEAGAVVRYPPFGWENIPLAEMLQDALDLPVSLDNMVRAIAHAETLYGAAREARDCIELYIGNIVGAAIVIDQLVRTGTTSAAGTLPGHLDELSDLRIVESALQHREIEGRGTTLAAIAAADSHPRLARLFAERSVAIAEAIAPIFDLLDPELLVVAGSPAIAERFFPIIQQHVGRTSAFGESAASRVVRSALGHDDLSVASASVRLTEVLNSVLQSGSIVSEIKSAP